MKLKLFLNVLAVTASLTGFAYDFTKDGKALCTIAVPENMTRFELMAKDDLHDVIQKITGTDLKVVPESEVKGPAIYVGRTKFASKKGIVFDKLGREEWLIRTAGKDLILTGGGEIGSYYAVLSLLQKAGYYMLTMDQEVYPKKKTLSVPNPDEKKSPSFAGRYIHESFPDSALNAGITKAQAMAYNLFQLRNYFNGDGQNARRLRPYYTGDFYNFRQMLQFHSMLMYVPPAKYFKTHPEYYSMDKNGRRVKPRDLGIGSSLCFSNPAVAKITLETLRGMIRQTRQAIPKEAWPRIYDISLLDNYPHTCYCPNCRKIVTEEGGAGHGDTGLMLRYINEIARTIRKEYPEIMIRTFAYSCCNMAPVKTKPEKNVLIQWCDLFSSADTYRPLEGTKYNNTPRKRLEEWSKTGANLMVWDYWNIASSPFMYPETVVNTIAPDLRFFRRNNVKGLFIEFEIIPYCPQNFAHLNCFLAGQLLANTDRDPEELIRIYMNGNYGPAAKEMTAYLNELRKGVKVHPSLQISIRPERWNYLTNAFVVQWYKRLHKLQSQVAEPYASRVRQEMLSLLWMIVSSPDSFRKDFAKEKITIESLEKQCYAWSKAYLNRYGWKKMTRLNKNFEEAWKGVSLRLPVPALFKNVPPERRRIIGYPLFREVACYNSHIVKDPEASSGLAVCSAHKDAERHGAGKTYKEGKHKWFTTAFYFSNVGGKGKVSLELKKVPTDEKYHWYRVPGTFELGSLAYFWGHGWGIQMNIGKFFILADGEGMSDVNLWHGWVHAKFTGPAYAPGSKKQNAIWVDEAMLTRPDEPSLSHLPKSGLVR